MNICVRINYIPLVFYFAYYIGGNIKMNEQKNYLFTSESVTAGHPDKMCDNISDAILDAIYKEDPNARVAVECLTKTGFVVVAG